MFFRIRPIVILILFFNSQKYNILVVLFNDVHTAVFKFFESFLTFIWCFGFKVSLFP